MSQEEKALKLLGSNVPNHIVASTLGVSESRVSQWLADADFAAKVAEARYESLAQYNGLDDKYNKIEDKLLTKLEKVLPLMMKPQDVLKGISVINAAKRRGAQSPDQSAVTGQIINLTVPVALVNAYKADAHNQIVEVTDGGRKQSLVTATSGSIDKLARNIVGENSADAAPRALEQLSDAEATPERRSESREVKRANSCGITVEDL